MCFIYIILSLCPFSNPVFTSLLAWIFLKERCTIWDCVFTVFTITGVILIARPPFIFGQHLRGIEGDYTNHIKGSIAAFAGDTMNTVSYSTRIELNICLTNNPVDKIIQEEVSFSDIT